MRSRVAALLKKPAGIQQEIKVPLDPEQIELVEKLSVFFSQESGRSIPPQQVIQEAVGAFTDESAEYIAVRYNLDLRQIPLTSVKAYSAGTCVAISARDTIVLPAREAADARRALFEERRWEVARADRNKLPYLSYLALYWGAPTSAVTHYARLTSYEMFPGSTDRVVFHLEPPVELEHPIPPKEPSSCLRTMRYTTLSLLLEAAHLEELF